MVKLQVLCWFRSSLSFALTLPVWGTKIQEKYVDADSRHYSMGWYDLILHDNDFQRQSFSPQMISYTEMIDTHITQLTSDHMIAKIFRRILIQYKFFPQTYHNGFIWRVHTYWSWSWRHMNVMAFQITDNSIICLTANDGYPPQKTSNVESLSLTWRHHGYANYKVILCTITLPPVLLIYPKHT